MESRALLWIGFNVAVLGVLAVDLGMATRRGQAAVSTRTAAIWTGVWVALSVAFAGAIWLLGDLGVWPWGGRVRAFEFLTAYVVEYALSVDNLFVFLMVFAFFRVRPDYQHKLLFWGVLSAFVMRAVLILLGSALVARFHWLMYVFGAFLVYTAIKLVVQKEEAEVDPEHNGLVKLVRRFFPVASGDSKGQFTVIEDGKRKVTSLFLVLLVVETTDLLFALDSIPAVLGLSTDPFIIYSSNICAVLGLRSLFFVVASLMERFHYIKYGLSAVLAFVGAKMMLSKWFHPSIGVSLGIIVGILVISIAASWLRPPKHSKTEGT